MENINKTKGFLPYLAAIFIFLIITFLYFSPLLSGKVPSMHDITMTSGSAKELVDYHEKTGIWAWWTNATFGGMPGFMIAGDYPYSISSKIGGFVTNTLPTPANVIFLLMVGFFILMISLKKNIWVSIIASVAYGLGTYNLLYTEAGHISKILALAYGPALLAGFVLIFNKKYLLGTFLTSLFLALQLYANHLQITYYFFFVLLAYSIYRAIQLFDKKETKGLLTIVGCFAISVFVGIGMNAERLWNNFDYSKETTRGKSELKSSTAGLEGLDKDYAFGWSYGVDETFNLLVPNLMGGGSGGSLPKSSETYKTLTNGGVDANMAEQFIKQLPLYFGKQTITSGPAYAGVIIIFLFILGLFISKGKFKWINASLILLFILLAMGNNFSTFNDVIFSYLPGYNKFRAVTQTLTIAYFLFVLAAANTLNDIISDKINWENIKKPLLYSAGIIAVSMFMGYLMVNFSGPNDEGFKNSLSQSLGAEFASKMVVALQNDRADLAFSDVIRGIILILLISSTLFLVTKNKINSMVFSIIAFVLITSDMFSVGKRYYNNDDFVSKSQSKVVFEPTAADLEILKDTDPNYRMINLTTSFWSDSRDSYFHKSIGGYHGAKLKKIEELYEYQMTKGGKLNMSILNMLNTKYFVTAGQNNVPVVQKNPEALGNAWFVDTLKVVNNADEELAFLEKFSPKTIAVTQKNQKTESQFFKTLPENKITLSKYTPNELTYSSTSQSPQFAIFSEVFYKGNKDWKSYIDGKEVPHIKVNYVLRGMEIPSGKHEIKFEFKPVSVEKGKKIDFAASIGLILLGIGAVIGTFRKKKD